ncbi:MAG: nucleotidyl transferase AbiEii/AbiGii toxin family protein [Armatimonadetes bacterium]|nr:nucleotidyl transferase AbiEii/AbiGii toxin family protein [Armatimonadota bacterium]
MHHEALTPALRSALERLGPFASSRGFYLAGGTALALQLGHRRSEDADWFTRDGISDPVALAAEIVAQASGFAITSTAVNTLHGSLGAVRVTWLGYPYPLLQPVIHADALNLDLSSLDDIAAMKLSAAAQRGARKDFVDLHALCRLHKPLSELLACYTTKYQVRDIGHVLVGLTYFDDADGEPPLKGLRATEWRAVRADLTRWARRVTG